MRRRLSRDTAASSGSTKVHAIAKMHNYVMKQLEILSALPRPMSAAAVTRHFVPFSTDPEFIGEKKFTHRNDFRLPLKGNAVLETALTVVLCDAVAGEVIAKTIGPNAVLREVTAICSEPGCPMQELHGDSEWVAKGGGGSENGVRVVTMFVALHDIMTEEMGATQFCLDTHHPRCFSEVDFPEAGGKWVAPTSKAGRAIVARGGKPRTWFPLVAGDATIMHSTIWHAGGANSSSQKRTILALTFVESDSDGGQAEKSIIRLRDFLSVRGVERMLDLKRTDSL